MNNRNRRRSERLLKTEALIVAYALSRLGRRLLQHAGWSTWTEAFEATGESLRVKPASINNLRDEFDPFFDNGRRGWVNRDVRPSRQRILGEFADVSDEALVELVDRILRRDADVRQLLVKPLALRSRASNVAEVLRTGREAERVFIARSEEIIGINSDDLLDCRDLACGYDFAMKTGKGRVYEVKGLRGLTGGIRFTDLEWRIAGNRRDSYVVVVIGDVFERPQWRVVPSPTMHFPARPSITRTVTVSWLANVSVA